MEKGGVGELCPFLLLLYTVAPRALRKMERESLWQKNGQLC